MQTLGIYIPYHEFPSLAISPLLVISNYLAQLWNTRMLKETRTRTPYYILLLYRIIQTSHKVFLLINLFTNTMNDRARKELLLISTVHRVWSSSSAAVYTFHNTISHGMKQFPKIKKGGVIVLINLLLLKI